MAKKKKETMSPEEVKQNKRTTTAQQWMPVADIEDCIVYRKDGSMLGIINIQPENLTLLSDNEKRRKIEALSEQLNGEKDCMQIFCIGRPVDLDNYLEWLQEKAKKEQDFKRKHILKGYIDQASSMAKSGETIERRFFMIFTMEQKKNSKDDMINRLKDMQIKLRQAELTVHICRDTELMDLYSLFANPIQASYERNNMNFNVSTILEY